MPALTHLEKTDNARCVVDAMGGLTHNYRFCIAPPRADLMEQPTPLGMRNVGNVFTELTHYIDYLIVRPDNKTSTECIQATTQKPLIGNRYVLKTGLKCLQVDINTKSVVCGPDNKPVEKILHKYVNNVSDGSSFLTGGQPVAIGNGLIPAIAGNITTLGTNIVNVAGSFTEPSKPYCAEAKMACHSMSGKDSPYNYSGDSPDGLFFSLNDLRDFKAEDFVSGFVKPNYPLPSQITNTCLSGNGFKNMEEIQNDINIINKNIIDQNSDKLIYPSNIDNIIDSINFNDTTLVKTYYLGLSLFMLLIMFKLLYSKHKIQLFK
uniref:Uncharacterized protein n=1 Tax=viral metagenome TaxID=1070528 RepID=A0A6C0DXZ4_9ZZZZ